MKLALFCFLVNIVNLQEIVRGRDYADEIGKVLFILWPK